MQGAPHTSIIHGMDAEVEGVGAAAKDSSAHKGTLVTVDPSHAAPSSLEAAMRQAQACMQEVMSAAAAAQQAQDAARAAAAEAARATAQARMHHQRSAAAAAAAMALLQRIQPAAGSAQAQAVQALLDQHATLCLQPASPHPAPTSPLQLSHRADTPQGTAPLAPTVLLPTHSTAHTAAHSQQRSHRQEVCQQHSGQLSQQHNLLPHSQQGHPQQPQQQESGAVVQQPTYSGLAQPYVDAHTTLQQHMQWSSQLVAGKAPFNPSAAAHHSNTAAANTKQAAGRGKPVGRQQAGRKPPSKGKGATGGRGKKAAKEESDEDYEVDSGNGSGSSSGGDDDEDYSGGGGDDDDDDSDDDATEEEKEEEVEDSSGEESGKRRRKSGARAAAQQKVKGVGKGGGGGGGGGGSARGREGKTVTSRQTRGLGAVAEEVMTPRTRGRAREEGVGSGGDSGQRRSLRKKTRTNYTELAGGGSGSESAEEREEEDAGGGSGSARGGGGDDSGDEEAPASLRHSRGAARATRAQVAQRAAAAKRGALAGGGRVQSAAASEEEEEVRPQTGRRRQRAAVMGESSDGDEEPGGAGHEGAVPHQQAARAGVAVPEIDLTGEGDEEDEPVSVAARKRDGGGGGGKRSGGKRQRQVVSDSEEEEEEEEGDGAKDLPRELPNKRARQHEVEGLPPGTSASHRQAAAGVSRGVGKGGGRLQRGAGDHEKVAKAVRRRAEAAAELADLHDGVVAAAGKATRITRQDQARRSGRATAGQRAGHDATQSALQRLQRMRAGRPAGSDDEPSSSDHGSDSGEPQDIDEVYEARSDDEPDVNLPARRQRWQQGDGKQRKRGRWQEEEQLEDDVVGEDVEAGLEDDVAGDMTYGEQGEEEEEGLDDFVVEDDEDDEEAQQALRELQGNRMPESEYDKFLLWFRSMLSEVAGVEEDGEKLCDKPLYRNVDRHILDTLKQREKNALPYHWVNSAKDTGLLKNIEKFPGILFSDQADYIYHHDEDHEGSGDEHVASPGKSGPANYHSHYRDRAGRHKVWSNKDTLTDCPKCCFCNSKRHNLFNITCTKTPAGYPCGDEHQSRTVTYPGGGKCSARIKLIYATHWFKQRCKAGILHLLKQQLNRGRSMEEAVDQVVQNKKFQYDLWKAYDDLLLAADIVYKNESNKGRRRAPQTKKPKSVQEAWERFLDIHDDAEGRESPIPGYGAETASEDEDSGSESGVDEDGRSSDGDGGGVEIVDDEDVEEEEGAEGDEDPGGAHQRQGGDRGAVGGEDGASLEDSLGDEQPASTARRRRGVVGSAQRGGARGSGGGVGSGSGRRSGGTGGGRQMDIRRFTLQVGSDEEDEGAVGGSGSGGGADQGRDVAQNQRQGGQPQGTGRLQRLGQRLAQRSLAHAPAAPQEAGEQEMEVVELLDDDDD